MGLRRGQWGWGTHCVLTVPAVPELRLPQVRQADEDGLADVALLHQGHMADGTTAAPRLQELLQRLVGGRPGLADSPRLPNASQNLVGLGAHVPTAPERLQPAPSTPGRNALPRGLRVPYLHKQHLPA